MTQDSGFEIRLHEAAPFGQALLDYVHKSEDSLEVETALSLWRTAKIVLNRRKRALTTRLTPEETSGSNAMMYPDILRTYAARLVAGEAITTDLNPKIEAGFATDLAVRFEKVAGEVE